VLPTPKKSIPSTKYWNKSWAHNSQYAEQNNVTNAQLPLACVCVHKCTQAYAWMNTVTQDGWVGGCMDGWVDVHSYVSVYVCMHAYMHVCIYVCMHAHMYIYLMYLYVSR
jgi:hypothetical protein